MARVAGILLILLASSCSISYLAMIPLWQAAFAIGCLVGTLAAVVHAVGMVKYNTWWPW